MQRKAIPQKVKFELAILSGARCSRCNVYLKEDFLTKTGSNFLEHAHIIGSSDFGPRGEIGATDKESIENILIVCPTCHKIIDDDLETYNNQVLFDMKLKHETRIRYLTSLTEHKRLVPVVFHSNIGNHHVLFSKDQIVNSILREGSYPYDNLTLDLSINSSLTDNQTSYYEEARREIDHKFIQYQKIISEHPTALFALAPQPLLIYLGFKLGNATKINVKQRSRELQSWEWVNEDEDINYIIEQPKQINIYNSVSLVIAISDTVSKKRIESVQSNSDVWILSTKSPNMNIIKGPKMIEKFKQETMILFSIIKDTYGLNTVVNVFPVMPNSLAVEFGRVWMPKINNPLIIYDQVSINNEKIFKLALEIR